MSSRIEGNEFNINGYTLFRRDRNRQGGGVVIYWHSELRPTLINDSISLSIELLGVKIIQPCNKMLHIHCIYRLPSSSALCLNVFYAALSQLTVIHGSVDLLGDFNIDQLKSLEFSDELQQSWDFKQFVHLATCITSSSSKLIDHLNAISSVDVCSSGMSYLQLPAQLNAYATILSYSA